MKTFATEKFNLKKLTLSVIVATTAFGGTAALSQTAVNGAVASQSVSETTLTGNGNTVSAVGSASANARGNAIVQTGNIAGSVRENGKAVVQAGANAASGIKAEAKDSVQSNAELVGEAAAAIQVRGDAESVTRVTSAVNADEDNVSVDAGALSESNLGLDVRLGGIRGSGEAAVENTADAAGSLRGEVNSFIGTTVAAGSDLVNDTRAGVDVSGGVDAAADLELDVSQSLVENTESEVDDAITETSATLRGGIETAFETGTDMSAEAQATAESATEVDAGLESDALEAQGTLVSNLAAEAAAEIDGESDSASGLAGTLDASIADAGAEATEATDVMSETSSDLHSDFSSNFSGEAASNLEATAYDVEQELSGGSVLDLTGNL